MTSPEQSDPSAERDFRLGEWLVQPSLNRLSCGEHIVQLEPKLMDVLVFLASRSGTVVSKQDITDAVWTEVFITESVITRAIAGIRRAFADDVRNPRFIETISKRGYRLVVDPEEVAVERAEGSIATISSTRSATPYVVGQWVRGEAFYGRRALLDEVLRGHRNWLWLMGTRRIGKTSTLKQLEVLADSRPELGYLPIFWDMQGAEDPKELALDFADAVLDSEDRLRRHGISTDDVCSEELVTSLGRLRRAARAKGLTLLLLCDEVEELIHLNRQAPALLRKLRRIMQSSEGIRSVLAASPRLWCLADPDADTSPFLDGFTPPIHIGALDQDDACALIRQVHLRPEHRPQLDDADVVEVARHSGGHPYLAQILCKKMLAAKSLDAALDQVAGDRSVSFFFEVDMELISEEERALLRDLANGDSPEPSADVAGALQHLQRLGMVRLDDDGDPRPASTFLERWLQSER